MKTPKLWQKFILAIGGLFLFEAGARIGIPGVDVQALSNYFLSNRGSGGLLGLYDRLGGGALSRGGLLAIGIMPYLSARIIVRLVRVISPAAEAMAQSQAGRRSLAWWTRGLTVGLALAQSVGFTRFMQTVQGVVVNPGPGFTAQTILLLTAGSVVMMLLSEQIMRPEEDDPPDQLPEALGAGMGDLADPTIRSREEVRNPAR